MIVENQSEVIEWLARPETFGCGISHVDRIDTHISLIFLAGDGAYKLKRSVRLPYLDFSSAELRRAACEAELRVNHRTAPDLYRRVVAVTRTADGVLCFDGDGQSVDWLVEMARFDDSQLFDRLAGDGKLDRLTIEVLADAVAGFHAKAEGCEGIDTPATLTRVVIEAGACFAEFAGDWIDAAKVAHWISIIRQRLNVCAGLLAERSAGGFVRRCHGDLHLRNIVAIDGRPVLFDAIEFSEDLARIDVLYDLAFLLMDLEFRALRPAASILFNRYLDDTGDAGGLATMPLFLSLRAAIRSHVVAAAAATITASKDQVDVLRATSQRYLDLACRYLKPQTVRLIAIGGFSGTGKSHLARELAPLLGGAPGARVVRTDTTRKRLAGVSATTRLAPTLYTEESSRQTYRAVFEEAGMALAAGYPVIADAVFAAPAEREAIAQVAVDAGVSFAGVWLQAPPPMLEQRVSQRVGNPSDATPAVVRLQRAYDLGVIAWPILDSSGPKGDTLAMARAVLKI